MASRSAPASTLPLNSSVRGEPLRGSGRVTSTGARASDPRSNGSSAALSSAQVVERLEAAQIANARVNTMAEVWAHPQLKARERWREVGSPAGSIPALLPPGSWGGDAGEPRMDPIPALGQHTDAILAELGLGADQIAALRAEGAV